MLLRLNDGEDITIENRSTGNHLVIRCIGNMLMRRDFDNSSLSKDEQSK